MVCRVLIVKKAILCFNNNDETNIKFISMCLRLFETQIVRVSFDVSFFKIERLQLVSH